MRLARSVTSDGLAAFSGRWPGRFAAMPTRALTALPTRRVGPVPFRVARFDDCIAALLSDVRQSGGLAVHFANAYTIALADTDSAYAELLARTDSAVLTDGVPVTWFGRRQNRDLRDDWQRVYGPDVMTAVLDHSGAEGPRHYLLGGSPATLTALESEIARRWPQAVLVGAESPPFRPLTRAEQAAQDDRIRQSGADMVWVGLGTPKQDWEVGRLADALPITALAVGAAFDFLAHVKPQAPLWIQRSGTEWAYRWASEPRRLTRRYLWGNPRFVYAAVRDRPRR